MINASQYQHLTSRVEEAKPGSLVFYYIWEEQDLQKFKERIKHLSNITFVINKEVDFTSDHNFIVLSSSNWRNEKARLAELFYPIRQDLIQFAVTGTNGKTTTSFLGMQLSKAWSKRAMYIGTLGIYIDNQWVQTNHGFTTPDIIDYREKVSKYQDRVDIVWIEASSHGLEQGRLDGVSFDGVGWTSFSQDHLDYHKTMNEYFAAKKNIFQLSKGISLLAEKIEGLEDYTVVDNLESYPDCPFLKIEYNKSNFKLAYGLLKERLGSPKKNLENNYYTPGRFQTLSHTDRKFVVDYAHTPDALEKILKQCRIQWPTFKILTVIGCGGNRDKSKRSLMGEIATTYSDQVIFTEDNSRSEKPEDIIKDISCSVKMNNFEIVIDRKSAIKKAIAMSDYKIVVIAGKGEESFIDRGDEKLVHSDFQFLEEEL